MLRFSQSSAVRLLRRLHLIWGSEHRVWIKSFDTDHQATMNSNCRRRVVTAFDTMLIAKAVYDNEAETSDELSFDREDILAVLEQDFNGMEGWWLCSLRGKTGIVPANRLQVIHKIDVRSSTPAVKGPRFPSEEVRPMDYDFPKPVVPKKIGGSFDNLLTITEDDCYRGGGGGGGSQLSRPSCVSSSSGKLEAQASLARKRGASVDNLLNSSNLAEYAVPISLSPDDYAVPGKNSGMKASNNPAKSSNEKGMNLSGLSSRDNQRPKTALSPNRLYETPKGHTDRHPKNLTMSELKLKSGDSSLADYDTPKSAATAAPFEGTGAKYPVGKSSTTQQPLNLTAKTPASAASKDPRSNASLSAAQKCEIVDTAFLTSLSEVQNAVVQITSYADKWRACNNPSMKQSIVKQVCVVVWKKLQALIVEFSKCLAKFKGRASLPLADRLGAIKVATADLEKILNYISSCHPNEIHKGCIDYVTELVIIAKDIAGHLDYCNSILNGDFRDLLDCPNKTSKQASHPSPSDSEHVTSPEADKRQMWHRRTPALPPPRVIPKISVNFDDDYPVSPARFNTKTPTYGRSFSYDHLSSDYDTPKSSRVEVGTNPDRESDKTAAILRGRDVRSADVERTKRDAVVLEKTYETFDILERRSLQSQAAPSKLVAKRLNSELTNKTGGLNTSNVVDYDYPKTQNAGTTSRDLGIPITVDDKRMLVFYGERLNTELNQLKDTCQAVRYCSAETSDGQEALLAQIKALITSAHRLVFIGDTLVRKLSGVGLKKQLQIQSLEIIEKAKSVALLAKSSPVSGKNVNRQQLFSDSTYATLAAATTFQKIIIASLSHSQ